MANEQINNDIKSLFSKTEKLLGWVSALFGCVFLILNLVVFSCIVPKNRNNKEFAVKFGTDISNYANVAAYELNDAYSTEAGKLSVENILKPSEYEGLYAGLTNFNKAYEEYTEALGEAYDKYSKSTAEEKDIAFATFKTEAAAAEDIFIGKLQLLSVTDGNISTAYRAFKNALAEYNTVLNNDNATPVEISVAKTAFENSSEKAAFEALLKELKDYLTEAKTYINYINEMEEDKPYVLEGITEYFNGKSSENSSSTGALQRLNDSYGAYEGAVSEYENNLTKSSVIWSVSPILSEVNRIAITASELESCQNDFISHLEMYMSVINALPKRLKEIKTYYNSVEERDGFSYFYCSESTRNAVLGATGFKENKAAFNRMLDDFGKFDLTFNFGNGEKITKEYSEGLTNEANSVLKAISKFDGAVADMYELGNQSADIALSSQTTIDILSIMLMVYNIILAVIFGGYFITLVTINRKAK